MSAEITRDANRALSRMPLVAYNEFIGDVLGTAPTPPSRTPSVRCDSAAAMNRFRENSARGELDTKIAIVSMAYLNTRRRRSGCHHLNGNERWGKVKITSIVNALPGHSEGKTSQVEAAHARLSGTELKSKLRELSMRYRSTSGA